MSGAIETVGFGKLPLYGTKEATFLLKGMSEQGRVNDIVNFLWGGLAEAEKENIGSIYECLYKKFHKGEASENGRLLHDGSMIGAEKAVRSEIKLGNNIFLVSEFLDTQRGLDVNGVNVSYTQTFLLPGIVAGIKKVSNNESTLTINPWSVGVAFNPGFIYRAGERFGKLVEGE